MTDTAAIDSKTIDHDPAEQPREPVTKRDLIEQNIDKVIDKSKAISVAVSADLGGTGFSNMMEVIETAKMMAMSGSAVPKWLRGNPGGCWAVTMQAIEWKFSPLAVARMSFEVNDNVAYMSQLLHAVIEARAPIQWRLRCEYEGEGAERVCIVTGTFIGETEPQIYRSPKFKDINPKNSPLWKNDADQQLWYFSSRAWCRRFAPDVLLGAYTKDELLDSIGGPTGPEGAIEVPQVDSTLHQRLKGVNREEGHRPGHAESELASVSAGGTTKLKPAPKEPEKAKETPAADQPARVPRSERRAKRKAAATPVKTDPVPTDAPKTEEKSAIQHKAELEQANAPTGKPKMAAEYWGYAVIWFDKDVPEGVAAADHADNLEARWDGERDLRDELGVPLKRRHELEALLTARCKELRGQE